MIIVVINLSHGWWNIRGENAILPRILFACINFNWKQWKQKYVKDKNVHVQAIPYTNSVTLEIKSIWRRLSTSLVDLLKHFQNVSMQMHRMNILRQVTLSVKRLEIATSLRHTKPNKNHWPWIHIQNCHIYIQCVYPSICCFVIRMNSENELRHFYFGCRIRYKNYFSLENWNDLLNSHRFQFAEDSTYMNSWEKL